MGGPLPLRGPGPNGDVLLSGAGNSVAVVPMRVPLAMNFNKEAGVRRKVWSGKAKSGGDILVSVLPLKLVEHPRLKAEVPIISGGA